MNKYTFETIVKKSIGNVVPNDIATIEGIKVEDRDGYFAVILNKGGSETRLSKKYWRLKNNNDRLKERRTAAGLSQSGLASASGVSLRMIQYYEQGRNDINKAEAGTVYLLATVLGCKVEDIIEPERLTE